MNIIILEDSSKAGFGGGQRITLDVIKVLRNFYSLYVFDTDIESLFSKQLKELYINPNKLKKINKRGLNSFFINFLDLSTLVINVFLIHKFLTKNKIEKMSLVYSTTKKGLLIAFLLKKIFKLDFIYHAHLIEVGISKKLVGYLTQSAFKVICVSQEVAKQFMGENVSMIFNSVEIQKFNYKTLKNKREFIVASISSLNYIKGIEYFVESYSFLKEKNIKYHIYGSGPLKRLEKTSINENIIFKGHISDVKETLYTQIDILVVPTIIAESFGMVILEAFSCGVPVIATNIGMQKVHILYSKAGEMIDIKNPECIANKIEYILSSEHRYSLYSKNGLKYAKKFDFNIFSTKILEIFNSYNFKNNIYSR